MHENFKSLRNQELDHKDEAWEIIHGDAEITNGFTIIDGTMRACLAFQDLPASQGEDLVTRVLAMRSFNTFAAAVSLITSGFPQPAFAMLRDIMEMVFLVDLFRQKPGSISDWLGSGGKGKEFWPAAVRKTLNDIHGASGKTERDKVYAALCEVAVHFSNRTPVMMRNEKADSVLVSGPFVSEAHLRAFAFEAARLGACLVESLDALRPAEHSHEVFDAMKRVSQEWASLNKDKLPGNSASYTGV